MTTKFAVGDKVLITQSTRDNMVIDNACRVHGRAWLSDSFLEKASSLVWVPGDVSHVFPPAHDTTMVFDGHSMHMKAHYAVRVHSMHGDFAIAYPGVLNRTTLEEGGSLHGYFRVISRAGEETSLYRVEECMRIIDHARNGELLGSFRP